MRGAPSPPIPLAGDSRAALRRDRRRAARLCRRRRGHPAGRRARDGHGRAPAAAGARRLRDQRRAAAGQAGRASTRASWPSSCRAARDAPTGSRRSTSPARASSTSRVEARRAGPGRGRDRRGRAAYGTATTGWPGREGQRRVRLGQPDRAGAPGRRPLGGGRRHARPAARGDRRRGHPRVLLQRPRRPDRPVRRVAAGRARAGEPTPEDGYAGQLHRRDRARGARRRARTSPTAGRRGRRRSFREPTASR